MYSVWCYRVLFAKSTRMLPFTADCCAVFVLGHLELLHESCLPLQNTQNAKVDEQVLVQIQDVNDIPPLLQPYDGAITENSPPILITTIKAIDKDASPEFRNVSTHTHRHSYCLSSVPSVRTGIAVRLWNMNYASLFPVSDEASLCVLRSLCTLSTGRPWLMTSGASSVCHRMDSFGPSCHWTGRRRTGISFPSTWLTEVSKCSPLFITLDLTNINVCTQASSCTRLKVFSVSWEPFIHWYEGVVEFFWKRNRNMISASIIW